MRPLLQVLEAEKWLSTFGPGLLGMLNPATGRLHPQYLVSGAKSGRWSARNPNIQQIPHDPDTRRIIIAAPGQVFVAGDFSSMELRAVAYISGETAMTEAFAASQDLHKLTAEAVLGVALDELGKTEKKQLRTLAKAINFGLIYGSGAKGLAESAWNSFGIPMSLEEAEAYRTGFFRKYPLLWRWMRAHADRCQREGRIAIGCGRVIETAWERHDSRGKCGLRYTLCCNAPSKAPARMR